MLETEDRISMGVEKRQSEKYNWNTVYIGSWVTEKISEGSILHQNVGTTTPQARLVPWQKSSLTLRHADWYTRYYVAAYRNVTQGHWGRTSRMGCAASNVNVKVELASATVAVTLKADAHILAANCRLKATVCRNTMDKSIQSLNELRLLSHHKSSCCSYPTFWRIVVPAYQGSSGPRTNRLSDAPCNCTDYLNKGAKSNTLAKDGVCDVGAVPRSWGSDMW
jgi:hypothetical protein